MNIRISSNFLSGVMFAGFGAAAMLIGWDYPLGTTQRMGAGYFPLIICTGLILVGASLIVRSYVERDRTIGEVDPRPLILVVASVVLFGFLIEDFGFPLVGVLLVVGAHVAGRDLKPAPTMALAVGLVVCCTAGFAYLLGLNLPHTRFW